MLNFARGPEKPCDHASHAPSSRHSFPVRAIRPHRTDKVRADPQRNFADEGLLLGQSLGDIYQTVLPQQLAVQGVTVAVQINVEVLTLMTCCVRLPFASYV